MRLAFLCLGVMGYPMAGHLARAGHDVRVYNRTAERADRWLEEYGDAGGNASAGRTPAAAVEGADVVLVCSGDDDDLRAVLLGEDGALPAIATPGLLIDHTTVSAALARELAAACEERSIAFLDAPISGGQSGAESGQLTVMVGGSREAFERAAPLFDCYARKSALMGPNGAGQLTKMVNQTCIAGLLQGLSEGLHLARRAGLDGERVVDVISKGAAQSWQMDNRASTMWRGEFEFGFAVDWMCKDLAIVLDEAKRQGARLEVTELVAGFYRDLQSRGEGRLDTSSLIRRLED